MSVIEILQISFAGIAFLLALLAYRLLRRQMDAPKADPKLLRSTTVYMVFAFGMAALAISAQLIDKIQNKPLPEELERRFQTAEARLGKAESEAAHAHDRLSGIRISAKATTPSPTYGCGSTQKTDAENGKVMYGLTDGTSCKIRNVNYYKELSVTVPPR
jgi:hypothetical protein